MDKCPRCKEKIEVVYRHLDFEQFNADLHTYGLELGSVGENPISTKIFLEFLSRMEESGFKKEARIYLENEFKKITDETKKTWKYLICKNCSFEVLDDYRGFQGRW